MLTPDNVTYTPPAIDTAAVESSFDQAINLASTSRKWPAVVRSARDGTSIEQIRAAIIKYRQAGWRVIEGFGDICVMIWHPSCPEVQQRDPGNPGIGMEDGFSQ